MSKILPEGTPGASRFASLARAAELRILSRNRLDADPFLSERAFSDWVLDTYEHQRRDFGVYLAGADHATLERSLAVLMALAERKCARPYSELLTTDLVLLARLCAPQLSGVAGEEQRPVALDWRVAALLLKAKTLSGRADITLRDLARPLHVTEHHLGHQFREHVGTSFRRYLWSIRLTTAAVRLSDSSLSLKEISGQLGHSDVSNFCNEFREGFEITPAPYRRMFFTS